MSSWQSVVDPAGPAAARIHDLWLLLFWVCFAIYVLVVGALAYAVARKDKNGRGSMVAIQGATAATVLILIGFFAASLSTLNGLSPISLPGQVDIEITGHQWWWEVRYPNAVASQIVTTANEIHIPVGRPVMLKLTSQDVIHSFWVPNLQGKRDLIPSHVTATSLQADKPGVYRGQCAEFCGLQHANMAFYVVAESAELFKAWLDGQRHPAVAPGDALLQRGQQVFLNGPCILCHTIRGIDAFGQNAPDLTHLGSRRSLAAGTLPNTLGHLGGWISDPQTIKPGNHMPPVNLDPDDVQPLLAYLESLK